MNPHISTGLALSRFSAGYPKRQVIRDLTVPRLRAVKSPPCWAPTAAANRP
ncbi:Uncharacterised protein [Raoultella terrigena]|uniref:Uncharacterized protein n=1 Tax=Raoultella terrigena TaxID=577 RepID=A0A485BG78_RAOTE|nr:Uncharacterised protein [Raoultella terrigena]